MDKEEILKKLNEIIDPEIGYGIVDLGQIEEIKVDEKEKKIYVKYLPTTPLCPFLTYLIDQIYLKIKELGYEAEVDIDLENRWTPDRIKKEIREKLGI